MKTKSKTQKPSERRSTKGIAKRAAEKKAKMERGSGEKDREQVKETEVKVAEVNDGIQLIIPKTTEQEKPILNEDDQKRVVNHPLRDDEMITGEEK